MERRNFLKWIPAGILTLFGVSAIKANELTSKPIHLIQGVKLKALPYIRLWKLGSDHRPTDGESINKLASILEAHGKANQTETFDTDIIWNHEIEVIQLTGNKDDIDIIELPDGNRRIIIKGYDE